MKDIGYLERYCNFRPFGKLPAGDLYVVAQTAEICTKTGWALAFFA